MAEHMLADAARRAGFLKVLALASTLAMGCGGDASSAEAGDNGAGEGRGSMQPEAAGSLQSGADPAPPSSLIAAGPTSRTDYGPPPPAPDPARAPVELTRETMTVGSREGGVEAAVFMAISPLGTTLELVEVSERICVRGQLAPVPGEDYANYWGGEVGLVLSSSPATEVTPPGEGLDTPGFAFRLEGSLPLQLRLRVGATGEVPIYSQYCQNVPSIAGASIEVPLSSLTYECWSFGGVSFPQASSATLLSWQIPANTEAGWSFDFCIEDIRALP